MFQELSIFSITENGWLLMKLTAYAQFTQISARKLSDPSPKTYVYRLRFQQFVHKLEPRIKYLIRTPENGWKKRA